MKWLYCYLDDEHYTLPAFSLFDSIEDAKKYCYDNAADNFSVEWSVITNEKYRCVYSYEGSFEVTELLGVEDAGCYLIWHHAYEGVNFKIIAAGNEKECMIAMEEKKKKIMADFPDTVLVWETSKQCCFDNGQEYEVLSIVINKNGKLSYIW